MIKDIQVSNLQDASVLAKTDHTFDVWIFAVDQENQQDVQQIQKDNYMNGNDVQYITQYFYDFHDKQEGGPSQENVDTYINSLEELSLEEDVEHNVLVISVANISRSPAIAFLGWYIVTNEKQAAWERIRKNGIVVYPNPNILRLADHFFKNRCAPPHLEDFVREQRDKQ